MSIKLLLAAAIASLIQADLLRGHLNNPLSSPLLESRISGNSNGSHRQLPKKKDINELKRINAERKKLNQETRRKKEKKELVIEKSAWKVCYITFHVAVVFVYYFGWCSRNSNISIIIRLHMFMHRN